MPLILLSPALGDAVVVDGTKYRIRALTATVARLRVSLGGQEAVTDPRSLTWDAGAQLWRTDRCTPTR